jgi:diguanylate cyclase (GGDEF)-like protein/PAS domain S-box-containing protein
VGVRRPAGIKTRRWPIALKLALPTLLLLAPFAFLLQFLFSTHERGIATARNEIGGVRIIATANEWRSRLLQSALVDDGAKGAPDFEAASRTFDAVETAWPDDRFLTIHRLQAQAGILNFSTLAKPSIEDVQSVMREIDTFIFAVNNASELILDPEIVTYFLMDITSIRHRAILTTLTDLHRMDRVTRAEGETGDRLRVAKRALIGALDTEAANLDRAIATIRRYSPDPSAIASFMAQAQAATDAMTLFALSQDRGDVPSFAPERLLSILDPVDRLTKSSAALLDQQLHARIARMTQERDRQIALSTGVLALTLTLMLWILNSAVLAPIRSVTRAMRRLAGGDTTVEIAPHPGKDEIADMIGAIRVFKATALDRSALARETAEQSAKLVASAELLARAERIAALGNWRYRIATGRLEMSDTLFDMVGFAREEGVPPLSAIGSRIEQADILRLLSAIEAADQGDSRHCHDIRIHHPASGMRHLRLWIEIERDERRLPVSLFGTAQDITSAKTVEIALKEKAEALSEAQAIGKIGNWGYRLGAESLTWSNEVLRIMGFEPGSFDPKLDTVRKMYLDDSLARLGEAQKRVLRDRTVEAVDIRARCGDGRIADITIVSKAEVDAAGNVIGFVGTIQDITARKQAERELEKLAFYDPLTALANRALFRRSIERHVRMSEERFFSSALLLLDLDRFKEVNDTLGHAAGDELLTIVAERLQRNLPRDAFIARLGGDEFALILPDADEAAARAIAGRVIELFEQPILLKAGEVNIGTSIGVALIPQDGSTPEDLIRHADLALYRAKDDGRNRMELFRPELSQIVQEKSRLARDLRRAIEQDTGLELHYQPQVDLRTHAITGFEALLRWNHPERGYVPPSEFVPIAESSTLVCDMGLWVLRAACRQMQAWIAAGQPARDIAVNVSPVQLWQTEFDVEVQRILRETGLNPGLLTLEVTENVFVRESEGRVRRILDNLRAIGVTLALDDFGTGYSSLGYLNELPFQKLKIDRVFVDKVDQSEQRQRLLAGIIALAGGLGMQAIAEGAERSEEVRVLAKLGCDRLQGYVLARPMPAHAVIAEAARIEQQWRERAAA